MRSSKVTTAVAIIAAGLLTLTSAQATCGDVDLSGSVSVLDALNTAQYSAQLVTLTQAQLDVADVDSNSVVNILDALQIARFSAGLSGTLSCPVIAPPPPATSKIFVGSAYPDQVTVIDHLIDQISGTIPISHDPNSLATDPVRDILYVASYTGTVSIVDTTTDTVISTFYVPGLAGKIDVTPDGSALVGVSTQGVVVVDLPAHTVRHSIFTGSYGYSNFITASPDSVHAWMSQSDLDSVVEVNVITGQVTATVNVGSAPYGIDISPSGNTVFVINHFDETISRVDTATDTEILPRQPVGIYPVGLLAHSSGAALSVNCISGNVSIHDGQTGAQSGVFQVGSEPMQIDEASDGDVSVINTVSNSVSIYDLGTQLRVDIYVGSSLTESASK